MSHLCVVFVMLFAGAFAAPGQPDNISVKASEMIAESATPEIVELPADYIFSVYRKGRKVGTHRISFARSGRDLEVIVELQIKISFGPLPLYTYVHSNREIWRDDRLVFLKTQTTENGKRFQVEGEASAEGFVLSGSDGDKLLPARIVTTNYWNSRLVEQTQLLDTQTGRVIRIDVVDAGRDESVGAQKYHISGDMALDIWYGRDRLRKILFEIDGTRIEYKPAE